MKKLFLLFSFVIALSAQEVWATEWVVTAGRVNLRSSANFSGSSNVIKTLTEGDRLTEVQEHDNYIEAVVSPTGEKGFIWKAYLERAGTHDVAADVQQGTSTTFAPPMCGCSTCRKTGSWGVRTHPISGRRKFHSGCDIGTQGKSPKVYASADGVVKFAGTNGGYGKSVEIEHGAKFTDKNNKSYNNGLTTRYAHLKTIASGITKGRSVRKGQHIGNVDSTGYSTGYHLHFEVISSQGTLNPEAFINIADTQKACSADGSPVGTTRAQ